MNIIQTPFEGLIILEPRVFKDDRGFFYEAYNRREFHSLGIDIDFVQDNESFSVKNVIRGLHFQKPPHAQTKLVRALQGRILDVVVDLRKDKKTFMKSFCIELSSENKRQILVPKGFAHGFSVLSDFAEMLYKCDDFYDPKCEGGVLFNDSELAIDWMVKDSLAIVTKKDLALPSLSNTTYW